MTIKQGNFINTISYKKWILALFMFVVIGLILIFEYLENERNRDLMSWQLRMSVMSEIKSKDIESILDKKKSQLRMLAENASLKLFLSQIKDNGLAVGNNVVAQQGHVRNLLFQVQTGLDLTRIMSQ